METVTSSQLPMAPAGAPAGGGDAAETTAATVTVVHGAASRELSETGQEPGRSAESQSGARGNGAAGSSSLDTQSHAWVEAVREREATRMRMFAKFVLLISSSNLVVLFLVGGHPTVKRAAALGLVACVLSGAWLAWHTRKLQDFSMKRVAFLAYILAVATFPCVYFWGIFSPASAVVMIGISFLGLGASERGAFFVYLASALTLGGAAVLVVAGVVADPGIFNAAGASLLEVILAQVFVQILLLSAYLIALVNRRSNLTALARLEKAARAIALREALLLEARQDLDRALEVRGMGRYSDQKLGEYQLGEVLGRGGMGEVYSAEHATSGSLAAVKLLHPEAMARPQQVTRFLREAEIAGRLRSPHVVQILEVGRMGEVPFIVMERLSGHDLAHHLRTRRRLSSEHVIDLLRQVGRGLADAHEAGIVHRDLKPQNIFLAENPAGGSNWKILDFGVSKLADSSGTLTQGHVIGTPAYMAPEQATGQEVDRRSDLYSLGVIAYRSLTGTPAFADRDIPSLLLQVVCAMPRQPSTLAPLSEDVDRVLALFLAKAPETRLASAAEMADALEAAAAGQLESGLRARADALLEAHPWGTRRVP